MPARRQRGVWSVLRAALAGGLVAWLFAATFFVHNASLHHALHEDAGQPSHQCALTLLEDQQLVTAGTVCAPEIRTAAVAVVDFAGPVVPFVSVRYLASFGRGPPV